MDRRQFLRNSTIAFGVGLANPASLGLQSFGFSPAFDTWADIRNQFSLEDGKIHMAQMLLASHPKPVKDAIENHRKNFDANSTEYWEHNFPAAEQKVLESAAAYLDAKPSEIALTDSTTQGLGTLYTGFRLNEGDEILTTTHDHYSTEKSLEYSAQKNGASIRRISLYDNPSEASVEEIVERLSAAVRPATRLIAVTWVHSSTGVKLPIRRMTDAVKTINTQRNASDRIYFSLDGVHGFGIENITMADLGCDYFVAGTHKWLFGPRGTGIIWAKENAWDKVIPTIPPFSYTGYGMYLGVIPEGKLNFSDLCSPGGFHAFEHRWALGDAFDFHLKIGKESVEQRTHQLSTRLKEGLSQISHVKLHTPLSEELSSGINCFEVEGMTPTEVVERLYSKNIVASTSPYRKSYARLTPCIINTEEEVDRCIAAVGALKP